jgi:4'-phosphopantetheinyl transferase EntD
VSIDPQIQTLFPSDVVAAQLEGLGDPTTLYPEEWAGVAKAVPKRVREFAGGRLCARRALAELGVVNFPLRAAEDRQPIWPSSIIGSITHTRGFCAAVVAAKKSFHGVGLDSEVIGDVSPDLWATICVPREAAWLDSLPPSDRPAAVTLIFSAKEAFYKCQYPMTSEWLDFHDLWIEPKPWGGLSAGAASTFAVHANRPLAVSAYVAFPVSGRYLFHGAYVSAGCALGRTESGGG